MKIKAPFIIQYYCSKEDKIKETIEKGMFDFFRNNELSLEGACIDSCAFFSFQIINHEIAYFKFHSFINDGEISFFGISSSKNLLKDRLKKDFQMIKEKNIQKIIIDIRDNQGGEITNIDYLLSYLTENDYKIVKKIGTKASYELGRNYWGFKPKDRNHLNMKFRNFCEKKDIFIPIDSIYYTSCIPDTLVREINSLVFKGKSCFLIGPGTFSAANLTAAIIKDNGVSTLIGEETDEGVNGFGNAVLFYLPRSGITCGVPVSSFYISTRQDSDMSNVKPDIEVKPDRNSLLKCEDVVLKKAIEWINDK